MKKEIRIPLAAFFLLCILALSLVSSACGESASWRIESASWRIESAFAANLYAVKPGDTLWGIAKIFFDDGSRYQEIAEINQINNPDLIYVGQELLIPLDKADEEKKGARSEWSVVEIGDATWYGKNFAGRLTRNGEVFDPNKLTAASNTLSYTGTVARVTNLSNGKSVVVRINDTGDFSYHDIIIDLSQAAFTQIASLSQGRIGVSVAIK